MGEIKVGEYVRTKTGYIDKIKGIDISFDNTKYYIVDDDYIYFRKQIIKHSKNIIDLIEPGDYVNGKRVFATENRINDNGEKVILAENYSEWTDDGVIANNEIKSIVTREMFESIKYEV